jgi:hypothetical protein
MNMIMNKIKILLILAFIQLGVGAFAQHQTATKKKGVGFYTNPIFGGDYPDPSILGDGDNYYVVHSSFEYYPQASSELYDRVQRKITMRYGNFMITVRTTRI